MVEVPNETYQVHLCGERGFDKLILARFDGDGSGQPAQLGVQIEWGRSKEKLAGFLLSPFGFFSLPSPFRSTLCYSVRTDDMSATGRFTFRAETSGIESFAFVGRYFMRSLSWTKRAWIASKKASLKVRTKKENALITMSKNEAQEPCMLPNFSHRKCFVYTTNMTKGAVTNRSY